MARFTLDPKAVLTARMESPMSLNSLEKECVRAKRGRSSATTTQLLTQDRFTPRAWSQKDTKNIRRTCEDQKKIAWTKTVLQSIFCVLQQKESHIGLSWHEGENDDGRSVIFRGTVPLMVGKYTCEHTFSMSVCPPRPLVQSSMTE